MLCRSFVQIFHKIHVQLIKVEVPIICKELPTGFVSKGEKGLFRSEYGLA